MLYKKRNSTKVEIYKYNFIMIIMIGIFFIFFLFNCTATKEITNISQIDTSDANIYQKDLVYLAEKIKEIHPTLTPNEFKYIDVDEFDKLAIETYYKLSEMQEKNDDNKYKFIYLASKLIAKLNDGHSGLPEFKYRKEPTLPVLLKWFGEELYIINAVKKYKNLKNKKVLKIGNIAPGIIKENVNEFISGDNQFHRNYFMNGIFICKKAILELLNLTGENNNVLIEYEDNGKINQITLSANKNWSQYIYLLVELYKNNFGKTDLTTSVKGAIWFKSLEEYNAMYFQLNKFFDSQTWSGYNFDFKNIFNELFTEIREKGLKYLVIDLRNNNGGVPYLAYQLLSYIKNEKSKSLNTYYSYYRPSEFYYSNLDEDPELYKEDIENGNLLLKELAIYLYDEKYIVDDKNININDNGTINLPEYFIFNVKKFYSEGIEYESPYYMPYPDEDLQFDGELYLLIGNKTASMGSTLSYIVKDNGYGKLIGEPTGYSSVSHPGAYSLTLPNTSQTLYLNSYMHVRTDEEARKREPDAIYPDIHIPTTFEDYINGIDPCWEYLVENVFNKDGAE